MMWIGYLGCPFCLSRVREWGSNFCKVDSCHTTILPLLGGEWSESFVDFCP